MSFNGERSDKTSAKILRVLLMGFLFLACLSAMTVEAADDSSAQNEPGEISLKTEHMPLEDTSAPKRPAENRHQIMHGRIDSQDETVAPAATPLTTTPSEETTQINENTATPAATLAADPDAANENKRERARPNTNYAGKSIGVAGVSSAPKVKEKKYSLNKQERVAKAQSVQGVVVHGDSPELQAYNEKRRKIKEHFKARLENREERKALKAGKRSSAGSGSK